MVADLDAFDALADRLDDARALVAHHHRRGPRPVAVHDVQVGMADAARAQLDEHLAAARALERRAPPPPPGRGRRKPLRSP